MVNYTFKNLENIKAISIRQPWASLIVEGYKNIENRTWPKENKEVNKWFFIHSCAKQKKPFFVNDKIKPEIKKLINLFKQEELPYSSIIGIMFVKNFEINCVDKKYFWGNGPTCWHISKVIKFDNPIKTKGQLRFWEPPENIWEKLDIELESKWNKINNFNEEIIKFKEREGEVEEHEVEVEESKGEVEEREGEENEILNIRLFCKTLSSIYLDSLNEYSLNEIKKIVDIIENNIKNKKIDMLPFSTVNSYFKYKKPKKNYNLNVWANSKGFISTTLELENSEKFKEQLLSCANKWFHSQIKKIDDIYNIGSEIEKFKEIDLTNIVHLKHLFSSKDRKLKLNLTKEQSQIARKALNGLGNAQFQPYKGWRLSGFGFWNHIRGSKYILTKVLPKALEEYEKIIGEKVKSKSAPHIIFKPPSEKEGELKSHIDGGTLNDMYFKAMYCSNIDEWVTNYGIQTLVHISGAKENEEGQTTLLGPMDVPTYFLILQMIHPKTFHDDMPIPKKGIIDNWIYADGPKFYDWYDDKTLTVINRNLKYLIKNMEPENSVDKIWFQKIKKMGYLKIVKKKANQIKNYKIIGKIKMLPENNKNYPYLVAWPKGFIHGSEITGNTPRLTITLPFDTIGSKENSQRFLKRLSNFAKGDLVSVKKDTKPYANGIVHKETITEVNMYKDFFKDY